MYLQIIRINFEKFALQPIGRIFISKTNRFIFIFSIVEEVGCFRDNLNDRAFPTMLKNLRGGIDWHHLEKIVQECAILAKESNYKVR